MRISFSRMRDENIDAFMYIRDSAVGSDASTHKVFQILDYCKDKMFEGRSRYSREEDIYEREIQSCAQLPG